jgi:hypothetical protein
MRNLLLKKFFQHYENQHLLRIVHVLISKINSHNKFFQGNVVNFSQDLFIRTKIDKLSKIDNDFTTREQIGSKDKINGIVPAYGDRYSATRGSRSKEHVFELRGYATVQEAWQALADN